MAKRTPNISWIGQTLGGRYEIESVLGQGGMSAVYKAMDPNLQRTVAIKLIHAHLSSDPEFVRRFEQEAAAVAQLRHPNIIQVYDFNHDDDQYYMVLEFVPGDTLRERLKTLSSAQQQLPLPEVIYIMATICDAVAYAHDRGMIHRDLKPPNVMLTPKGDPILMDFGVAKMLGGTHHTATGAIIGTAKYMSPEQAKGERPDERSDIYALGVMLYKMVAGQAPFEADTSVAVLMKHVNEPVPDIRQIQHDAPDQLVAIIGKALAKKPDDRYRSAATMGAALRSINLQSDEMGATMLQGVPAKERTGTEPSLPKGTGVTAAPAATGQAGLQSLAGNRLPLIIGALAIILILVLGAAAFFFFSGGSDSGENGGEVPVAAGGDPDLPSSEGMVRINSGSYTVGLDPADRDHSAAQQIDLSEFWVDLHEVTNAEYAQFVVETDADAPSDWPD
ncbi:MAG TPA: protein kinase, partial [Anaerolineae bacterium]